MRQNRKVCDKRQTKTSDRARWHRLTLWPASFPTREPHKKRTTGEQGEDIRLLALLSGVVLLVPHRFVTQACMLSCVHADRLPRGHAACAQLFSCVGPFDCTWGRCCSRASCHGVMSTLCHAVIVDTQQMFLSSGQREDRKRTTGGQEKDNKRRRRGQE